MSNPSKKISRTFPSRTEQLLEVRQFVSEAAREFGFDDEEVANIALAVDEACTNIIKHAYQYARDKEIQITVNRAHDVFEVRITDEGRPFDPAHLRTPNLQDHLTHYRKGGLGVYLMRRLMDAVEYNIKPGSRNEVRMVKNLFRAPSNTRK